MSSHGGDDGSELRLKSSSSNKETIDIGLFDKRLAVAGVSRSAVLDSSSSSDFGRDGSGQPRADVGVSFLSDLRSSGLSSTDGPDRLVGDNNAAPVGDRVLDSV